MKRHRLSRLFAEQQSDGKGSILQRLNNHTVVRFFDAPGGELELLSCYFDEEDNAVIFDLHGEVITD